MPYSKMIVEEFVLGIVVTSKLSKAVSWVVFVEKTNTN
jgi:hypothetical protein